MILGGMMGNGSVADVLGTEMETIATSVNKRLVTLILVNVYFASYLR